MTKIGLFGLGCVGQGFYETLAQNQLPAKVARIVVRDAEKERQVDNDLLSLDARDILDNEEISVVVELIDDADSAYQIVREALRKGKSVITANKKMVSTHLPELHRLASHNNAQLFYEGAVCGAIPVIQNLDRYFQSESLNTVEGIVNGSTNYILSKVLDENLSYQEALKQAQQNGFAETDPSLDVDGHDPSFKLRILIWHAFGLNAPAGSIFRRGIRQIQRQDVRYAQENGWKIKLLARARYQDGQLHSIIAPHFVTSQDPLFYVNNEFNSVQLTGAYSGTQSLTGKGAGSLPTGLAVLSDLHALLAGQKTRTFTDVPLADHDDPWLRTYVGFSNDKDVPEYLFDSIDEHFVGHANHGYTVGKIKQSALQQVVDNDDVSVILLPDHLNIHARMAKRIAPLPI